MLPVDSDEIQITTISPSATQIRPKIAPILRIEATLDDQDTNGVSSGRSRLQLTATLLALFVRAFFVYGAFPVSSINHCAY
jgi:hypothetical protein